MYAARSTIHCVNELRYHLFRANKGTVDSGRFPPCNDILYQHSLRANYQSAIRRRSLVEHPDFSPPQNNHGWTIGHDGQLDIKWMTGAPAPQVIMEFLSCKCLRKCQLPECECMSNDLKCVEKYRLHDCANTKDVEDDDDDDSRLNDEDSDSESNY